VKANSTALTGFPLSQLEIRINTSRWAITVLSPVTTQYAPVERQIWSGLAIWHEASFLPSTLFHVCVLGEVLRTQKFTKA